MAKLLYAARRRVNCQSINMQFFFVFFVFCCFIDGELVHRWISYISIPSNICQTDSFFSSLSKKNALRCFRHLPQLCHLLALNIKQFAFYHLTLYRLNNFFMTFSSITHCLAVFKYIWMVCAFWNRNSEMMEKKKSWCRSWWTKLSSDFVSDIGCEMCDVRPHPNYCHFVWSNSGKLTPNFSSMFDVLILPILCSASHFKYHIKWCSLDVRTFNNPRESCNICAIIEWKATKNQGANQTNGT